MAWGDSKHEALIAENSSLSTKVEFLELILVEKKEEMRELKFQLKNTQDALIAKESPEAYRDQMYSRSQAEDAQKITPQDIENQKKRLLQAELEKKLLLELESPLFKDADDMISMLLPALNTKIGQTSLHDNGES